MHRQGKIKKPRKSILFRLCILAFIVYAVVTLLDMQVVLAERRQEVVELQQKLEVQRVANKELERQLATGADEEYIEKVARDQLDYVYPDEQVFIDISGS